jgi:hypothetical protein
MTVSESKGPAARVFAASREMSLSAEFFLDILQLLSNAIRNFCADNRNFGSDPARLPNEQKGQTAKIENRK